MLFDKKENPDAVYNKQSIATEQWVDSAPNDADLSVIASVHGEVLYSEVQTTGVRRPHSSGVQLVNVALTDQVVDTLSFPTSGASPRPMQCIV